MLRKVKLIDQKKTGLLPEHKGIAPVTHEVRATIPVLEAVFQAGGMSDPLGLPRRGHKIVFPDLMPAGIVAVHLNHSDPRIGLRLESEEPYPQEYLDYWATVDFTPCPVCQAPVVWYEAGYVPGYRVCTKTPHHHSLAQ
jgi:hypothetical protein